MCVCVWVRLLDTFAVDLWHNLWYEIYVCIIIIYIYVKARL